MKREDATARSQLVSNRLCVLLGKKEEHGPLEIAAFSYFIPYECSKGDKKEREAHRVVAVLPPNGGGRNAGAPDALNEGDCRVGFHFF